MRGCPAGKNSVFQFENKTAVFKQVVGAEIVVCSVECYTFQQMGIAF
jgi:hypothetical protein